MSSVEAPTGLGDAAARGTGVTLATQLVRAGLQFGSVIVLARLLSAEDFGLVAMVTAVIGVSDLIRDFGLSSAAIQTRVLSVAERSNLFWANLGLGAACALTAVAGRTVIEDVYGDRRLGRIVVVLAVVFVLSGANTQFRTDLTRRLRFRALALSDIASQAAGICLAIGLGLAGFGFWAIVWQQVAAAVVSLTMNATSAGWCPSPPRRDVSIRRFFRYGGGLLGTQLVGYATKNIDNIGIGAYWGAAPLGIYSRAYQLLMMPLNQINAPMTRVALPVLSRVQDDDVTFARYLEKVQLIACYLTATVFAVAAALAGPLVRVLFGPTWSSVAPIFAVLAVGGVFRAIAQIAYWVYLARGMPGQQLRLMVATGPFMVLIILAGLPWGPLGVAVGHSVAYFLYWAVSLVHVGRVANVDSTPLFRNAARAVGLVSIPAGLAAAAATAMPVPALLQLVLGAVFALLYVTAAHRVLPPVRRDLDMVIAMARRAAPRRRTAPGT